MPVGDLSSPRQAGDPSNALMDNFAHQGHEKGMNADWMPAAPGWNDSDMESYWNQISSKRQVSQGLRNDRIITGQTRTFGEHSFKHTDSVAGVNSVVTGQTQGNTFTGWISSSGSDGT